MLAALSIRTPDQTASEMQNGANLPIRDRRFTVSAVRRSVLAGGLAALATGVALRPARSAPIARALDPRFAAVVGPEARLVTLYAQGRWCEGLCLAPALGGLVFSDVKANRISILEADGRTRTLRDPSNNANGNALDAEGRLVSCEHRGRRVVRQDADGAITVLADRYAGLPLNSPNDIVLGPDGALWFTDPVFGITMPDEGIMAKPAQGARRVYRIAPDGRLDAATDTVDQPNGLAFSPDGQTLYVSDAGAALNPEAARSIHAFTVSHGRLGSRRTFATLETGAPDGLEVDTEGRLYVACDDGVRVFLPDGAELGRITTPTPAANVAFGGREGRRLYIAAGAAIHAVDLKARGRV